MTAEKEKEIALPFINEARKITLQTDQKVICNLVSRVCDSKYAHPRYTSLKMLHKALSEALKGQINCSTTWTSTLDDNLDKIVKLYL